MSYPFKGQNQGHRLRLRERFCKTGLDGLHDYELLELLLTYAIPRRDVKPLAKYLIGRFKTVTGVLEASPEALKRVAGLGERSTAFLKLIKAAAVRTAQDKLINKNLLTSPEAVVNFVAAKLAGLPHEAFMAIFLSIQNEVLGHKILNEGTVDQVAVYPRRVIEAALEGHAGGLILAHNHPSGTVEPSEDDKRLTQSIQAAGKLFDIRVVDHIIVGKGRHFSFIEEGLLN